MLLDQIAVLNKIYDILSLPTPHLTQPMRHNPPLNAHNQPMATKLKHIDAGTDTISTTKAISIPSTTINTNVGNTNNVHLMAGSSFFSFEQFQKLIKSLSRHALSVDSLVSESKFRGHTIISYALLNNNLPAVQYLIKLGASLDIPHSHTFQHPLLSFLLQPQQPLSDPFTSAHVETLQWLCNTQDLSSVTDFAIESYVDRIAAFFPLTHHHVSIIILLILNLLLKRTTLSALSGLHISSLTHKITQLLLCHEDEPPTYDTIITFFQEQQNFSSSYSCPKPLKSSMGNGNSKNTKWDNIGNLSETAEQSGLNKPQHKVNHFSQVALETSTNGSDQIISQSQHFFRSDIDSIGQYPTDHSAPNQNSTINHQSLDLPIHYNDDDHENLITVNTKENDVIFSSHGMLYNHTSDNFNTRNRAKSLIEKGTAIEKRTPFFRLSEFLIAIELSTMFNLPLSICLYQTNHIMYYYYYYLSCKSWPDSAQRGGRDSPWALLFGTTSTRNNASETFFTPTSPTRVSINSIDPLSTSSPSHYAVSGGDTRSQWMNNSYVPQYPIPIEYFQGNNFDQNLYKTTIEPSLAYISSLITHHGYKIPYLHIDLSAFWCYTRIIMELSFKQPSYHTINYLFHITLPLHSHKIFGLITDPTLLSQYPPPLASSNRYKFDRWPADVKLFWYETTVAKETVIDQHTILPPTSSNHNVNKKLVSYDKSIIHMGLCAERAAADHQDDHNGSNTHGPQDEGKGDDSMYTYFKDFITQEQIKFNHNQHNKGQSAFQPPGDHLEHGPINSELYKALILGHLEAIPLAKPSNLLLSEHQSNNDYAYVASNSDKNIPNMMTNGAIDATTFAKATQKATQRCTISTTNFINHLYSNAFPLTDVILAIVRLMISYGTKIQTNVESILTPTHSITSPLSFIQMAKKNSTLYAIHSNNIPPLKLLHNSCRVRVFDPEVLARGDFCIKVDKDGDDELLLQTSHHQQHYPTNHHSDMNPIIRSAPNRCPLSTDLLPITIIPHNNRLTIYPIFSTEMIEGRQTSLIPGISNTTLALGPRGQLSRNGKDMLHSIENSPNSTELFYNEYLQDLQFNPLYQYFEQNSANVSDTPFSTDNIVGDPHIDPYNITLPGTQLPGTTQPSPRLDDMRAQLLGSNAPSSMIVVASYGSSHSRGDDNNPHPDDGNLTNNTSYITELRDQYSATTLLKPMEVQNQPNSDCHVPSQSINNIITHSQKQHQHLPLNCEVISTFKGGSFTIQTNYRNDPFTPNALQEMLYDHLIFNLKAIIETNKTIFESQQRPNPSSINLGTLSKVAQSTGVMGGGKTFQAMMLPVYSRTIPTIFESPHLSLSIKLHILYNLYLTVHYFLALGGGGGLCWFLSRDCFGRLIRPLQSLQQHQQKESSSSLHPSRHQLPTAPLCESSSSLSSTSSPPQQQQQQSKTASSPPNPHFSLPHLTEEIIVRNYQGGTETNLEFDQYVKLTQFAIENNIMTASELRHFIHPTLFEFFAPLFYLTKAASGTSSILLGRGSLPEMSKATLADGASCAGSFAPGTTATTITTSLQKQTASALSDPLDIPSSEQDHIYWGSDRVENITIISDHLPQLQVQLQSIPGQILSSFKNLLTITPSHIFHVTLCFGIIDALNTLPRPCGLPSFHSNQASLLMSQRTTGVPWSSTTIPSLPRDDKNITRLYFDFLPQLFRKSTPFINATKESCRLIGLCHTLFDNPTAQLYLDPSTLHLSHSTLTQPNHHSSNQQYQNYQSQHQTPPDNIYSLRSSDGVGMFNTSNSTKNTHVNEFHPIPLPNLKIGQYNSSRTQYTIPSSCLNNPVYNAVFSTHLIQPLHILNSFPSLFSLYSNSPQTARFMALDSLFSSLSHISDTGMVYMLMIQTLIDINVNPQDIPSFVHFFLGAALDLTQKAKFTSFQLMSFHIERILSCVILLMNVYRVYKLHTINLLINALYNQWLECYLEGEKRKLEGDVLTFLEAQLLTKDPQKYFSQRYKLTHSVQITPHNVIPGTDSTESTLINLNGNGDGDEVESDKKVKYFLSNGQEIIGPPSPAKNTPNLISTVSSPPYSAGNSAPLIDNALGGLNGSIKQQPSLAQLRSLVIDNFPRQLFSVERRLVSSIESFPIIGVSPRLLDLWLVVFGPLFDSPQFSFWLDENVPLPPSSFSAPLSNIDSLPGPLAQLHENLPIGGMSQDDVNPLGIKFHQHYLKQQHGALSLSRPATTITTNNRTTSTHCDAMDPPVLNQSILSQPIDDQSDIAPLQLPPPLNYTAISANTSRYVKSLNTGNTVLQNSNFMTSINQPANPLSSTTHPNTIPPTAHPPTTATPSCSDQPREPPSRRGSLSLSHDQIETLPMGLTTGFALSHSPWIDLFACISTTSIPFFHIIFSIPTPLTLNDIISLPFPPQTSFGLTGASTSSNLASCVISSGSGSGRIGPKHSQTPFLASKHSHSPFVGGPSVTAVSTNSTVPIIGTGLTNTTPNTTTKQHNSDNTSNNTTQSSPYLHHNNPLPTTPLDSLTSNLRIAPSLTFYEWARADTILDAAPYLSTSDPRFCQRVELYQFLLRKTHLGGPITAATPPGMGHLAPLGVVPAHNLLLRMEHFWPLAMFLLKYRLIYTHYVLDEAIAAFNLMKFDIDFEPSDDPLAKRGDSEMNEAESEGKIAEEQDTINPLPTTPFATPPSNPSPRFNITIGSSVGHRMVEKKKEYHRILGQIYTFYSTDNAFSSFFLYNPFTALFSPNFNTSIPNSYHTALLSQSQGFCDYVQTAFPIQISNLFQHGGVKNICDYLYCKIAILMTTIKWPQAQPGSPSMVENFFGSSSLQTKVESTSAWKKWVLYCQKVYNYTPSLASSLEKSPVGVNSSSSVPTTSPLSSAGLPSTPVPAILPTISSYGSLATASVPVQALGVELLSVVKSVMEGMLDNLENEISLKQFYNSVITTFSGLNDELPWHFTYPMDVICDFYTGLNESHCVSHLHRVNNPLNIRNPSTTVYNNPPTRHLQFPLTPRNPTALQPFKPQLAPATTKKNFEQWAHFRALVLTPVTASWFAVVLSHGYRSSCTTYSAGGTTTFSHSTTQRPSIRFDSRDYSLVFAHNLSTGLDKIKANLLKNFFSNETKDDVDPLVPISGSIPGGPAQSHRMKPNDKYVIEEFHGQAPHLAALINHATPSQDRSLIDFAINYPTTFLIDSSWLHILFLASFYACPTTNRWSRFYWQSNRVTLNPIHSFFDRNRMLNHFDSHLTITFLKLISQSYREPNILPYLSYTTNRNESTCSGVAIPANSSTDSGTFNQSGINIGSPQSFLSMSPHGNDYFSSSMTNTTTMHNNNTIIINSPNNNNNASNNSNNRVSNNGYNAGSSNISFALPSQSPPPNSGLLPIPPRIFIKSPWSTEWFRDNTTRWFDRLDVACEMVSNHSVFRNWLIRSLQHDFSLEQHLNDEFLRDYVVDVIDRTVDCPEGLMAKNGDTTKGSLNPITCGDNEVTALSRHQKVARALSNAVRFKETCFTSLTLNDRLNIILGSPEDKGQSTSCKDHTPVSEQGDKVVKMHQSIEKLFQLLHYQLSESRDIPNPIDSAHNQISTLESQFFRPENDENRLESTENLKTRGNDQNVNNDHSFPHSNGNHTCLSNDCCGNGRMAILDDKKEGTRRGHGFYNAQDAFEDLYNILTERPVGSVSPRHSEKLIERGDEVFADLARMLPGGQTGKTTQSPERHLNSVHPTPHPFKSSLSSHFWDPSQDSLSNDLNLKNAYHDATSSSNPTLSLNFYFSFFVAMGLISPSTPIPHRLMAQMCNSSSLKDFDTEIAHDKPTNHFSLPQSNSPFSLTQHNLHFEPFGPYGSSIHRIFPSPFDSTPLLRLPPFSTTNTRTDFLAAVDEFEALQMPGKRGFGELNEYKVRSFKFISKLQTSFFFRQSPLGTLIANTIPSDSLREMIESLLTANIVDIRQRSWEAHATAANGHVFCADLYESTTPLYQHHSFLYDSKGAIKAYGPFRDNSSQGESSNSTQDGAKQVKIPQNIDMVPQTIKDPIISSMSHQTAGRSNAYFCTPRDVLFDAIISFFCWELKAPLVAPISAAHLPTTYNNKINSSHNYNNTGHTTDSNHSQYSQSLNTTTNNNYIGYSNNIGPNHQSSHSINMSSSPSPQSEQHHYNLTSICVSEKTATFSWSFSRYIDACLDIIKCLFNFASKINFYFDIISSITYLISFTLVPLSHPKMVELIDFLLARQLQQSAIVASEMALVANHNHALLNPKFITGVAISKLLLTRACESSDSEHQSRLPLAVIRVVGYYDRAKELFSKYFHFWVHSNTLDNITTIPTSLLTRLFSTQMYSNRLHLSGSIVPTLIPFTNFNMGAQVPAPLQMYGQILGTTTKIDPQSQAFGQTTNTPYATTTATTPGHTYQPVSSSCGPTPPLYSLPPAILMDNDNNPQNQSKFSVNPITQLNLSTTPNFTPAPQSHPLSLSLSTFSPPHLNQPTTPTNQSPIVMSCVSLQPQLVRYNSSSRAPSFSQLQSSNQSFLSAIPCPMKPLSRPGSAGRGSIPLSSSRLSVGVNYKSSSGASTPTNHQLPYHQSLTQNQTIGEQVLQYNPLSHSNEYLTSSFLSYRTRMGLMVPPKVHSKALLALTKRLTAQMSLSFHCHPHLGSGDLNLIVNLQRLIAHLNYGEWKRTNDRLAAFSVDFTTADLRRLGANNGAEVPSHLIAPENPFNPTIGAASFSPIIPPLLQAIYSIMASNFIPLDVNRPNIGTLNDFHDQKEGINDINTTAGLTSRQQPQSVLLLPTIPHFSVRLHVHKQTLNRYSYLILSHLFSIGFAPNTTIYQSNEPAKRSVIDIYHEAIIMSRVKAFAKNLHLGSFFNPATLYYDAGLTTGLMKGLETMCFSSIHRICRTEWELNQGPLRSPLSLQSDILSTHQSTDELFKFEQGPIATKLNQSSVHNGPNNRHLAPHIPHSPNSFCASLSETVLFYQMMGLPGLSAVYSNNQKYPTITAFLLHFSPESASIAFPFLSFCKFESDRSLPKTETDVEQLTRLGLDVGGSQSNEDSNSSNHINQLSSSLPIQRRIELLSKLQHLPNIKPLTSTLDNSPALLAEGLVSPTDLVMLTNTLASMQFNEYYEFITSSKWPHEVDWELLGNVFVHQIQGFRHMSQDIYHDTIGKEKLVTSIGPTFQLVINNPIAMNTQPFGGSYEFDEQRSTLCLDNEERCAIKRSQGRENQFYWALSLQDNLSQFHHSLHRLHNNNHEDAMNDSYDHGGGNCGDYDCQDNDSHINAIISLPSQSTHSLHNNYSMILFALNNVASIDLDDFLCFVQCNDHELHFQCTIPNETNSIILSNASSRQSEPDDPDTLPLNQTNISESQTILSIRDIQRWNGLPSGDNYNNFSDHILPLPAFPSSHTSILNYHYETNTPVLIIHSLLLHNHPDHFIGFILNRMGPQEIYQMISQLHFIPLFIPIASHSFDPFETKRIISLNKILWKNDTLVDYTRKNESGDCPEWDGGVNDNKDVGNSHIDANPEHFIILSIWSFIFHSITPPSLGTIRYYCKEQSSYHNEDGDDDCNFNNGEMTNDDPCVGGTPVLHLEDQRAHKHTPALTLSQWEYFSQYYSTIQKLLAAIDYSQR